VSENFGHYQPNCVYLIQRILKRLNTSKDQNFLDIGSGKGRILLIAAQYDFNEVRGIEFSEPLCDITKQNIERFKTKVSKLAPIEVQNMDARDYVFTEKDVVIFMYNPFNGSIFETVIKNLKASIERYPRTITFIYMHPTEKKCVESILPITTKQAYTWNEDYIIYTIN
jgi:predicted RNA methylase